MQHIRSDKEYRMPFTIFVRFSNETSLENAAASIMKDSAVIQIEKNGREMHLTIPDAKRTLISLALLRSIPGTDQISARDADGWECEEIDLMSLKDREELGENISSVPAEEEKSVPAQERRLILASKSPRRQELLHLLGVPFTAVAADVSEDAMTCALKEQYGREPFSVMAAKIVMNLAAAKAQKVLEMHSDAVVIGSDTIVTMDDCIFGKPSSPEDALEMLCRLSGRDHHVFTGVSIQCPGKTETFFTVTRVGFFPWDECGEELAHRYTAGGSPLDKAGAYGIQDMGSLFIRGIKGDYYTVMGFPVSEIYRRLKDFHIT